MLSIKSIQDHMGAPRGQPLEPCPLGAPVESLWGCCPSDPALWEFLWKAFGDTAQRTLPSLEALVEGLNNCMHVLDENILVIYIWSKL